ncbi:MAG: putative ABC transport system permease protein [Myxococcota bacterium]|jgi:putative ABC transport system permease protein
MNLLRSPKRVGLSLISVVAGVCVFILGDGFANGLTENVIRAEIDSVGAHVTLTPLGYDSDAFTRPIEDAYALTDATRVTLDEQAQSWTRRILFSPEGIVGSDGIRLRGVAYDPASDEAVFPRDTWVVRGDMPTPENGGVLLAVKAAKLLGVEDGDWLTLRTRTVDGALNALQVPVSGILSAGNPIIDVNTVMIPWPLAEDLLQHHERTTHVHARLGNRRNAAPLAELLRTTQPDAKPETWERATAELVQMMEMRRTIFRVLSFALLAMAATGIANTILMAAYERVREVGTLRAMGMTRRQVTALFLIEGAFLGIVGGLLGAALGGFATYYWSVHGIDLAPLMEQSGDVNNGIAFSTMLYLYFSPPTIAVGVVIGASVATIASVYPARAASALSPADAVRA